MTALFGLLLGAALAAEPTPEAPPPRSLPEWRDERSSLDRAVDQIEALEEATARLHNALAMADHTGPAACAGAGNHVARARVLGRAWEARVQGVEDRLAVLQDQADGALVAPLLDQAARERLASLVGEVVLQRRRVDEAAAWDRRHLRPCPAGIAPGPGIEGGLPERATAVIALGPGVACPDSTVLQDAPTAVVLPSDEGCVVAGEDCTCSPGRVLPGAVLAPPP